MKSLLRFLAIAAMALPVLFSCEGVDETVPVSSVELSKTSLDLVVGDEATLSATVKPADATEKTISWRSSDENVATVNNGRVKAVKPGSATITATAGGKSATCSVRVSDRAVPVTSVSLDKTSLELEEGEEAILAATVLPADATDKTVNWTSSNTSVATVAGGTVKAVKAGTATITAKAGDRAAECTVTVKEPFIAVTSVSLDRLTLDMTEGDEITLMATVLPDNATDPTVTWNTSDATVATVQDGKVKAVKDGSALVTAKAGDKTARCLVTVNKAFIPVASITLDKTELTLLEGDIVQLTVTVKPDNATDKTVTWTSSDLQVVEADKDGIVYAHYAGTAVLTAKAGDKTATCTVTVEKPFVPVEWIGVTHPSVSMKVGEEVQMYATVKPDDATDKTVTWTSSDETLATVTDGLVKALKAGEVVITAKAGDKTAESHVRIEAVVVPVTSVTLDKTTLALTEGEEATLTATVKPDDATDKIVTWTSSDPAVATVQDGLVKAVKAGTATIVADAGGKYAECIVTVGKADVPVTSITLDRMSLDMVEGEEATLTATVLPDDATDKTVTWTTSNPSVATVQDGRVKAVKEGSAMITAKAGGKMARCLVTVVPGVIPVASITLDRTELALLEGTQDQLVATVLPDNATDKTVAWTSSNTAVATVQDGLVKAVKAGTATITAKAGDKTAQCVVTVTEDFIPVTSISLDRLSLDMTEGEEITLTATVKPDDATDKTVTWTTSDATVATVTAGRVKAVKAGTATITAKAGDKTATCQVTVKEKYIPVTSISLDRLSLDMTEGDEITLTATVLPDDATDKTVTWTSSKPSVATVQDGRVKAVKEGSAMITAKAGGKTARCLVTVSEAFIPVASITLNKSSLSLVEGEEFLLVATVLPENATDPTVTWISQDETVVTVTDGLVKALKAGSTNIIAKAGTKSAVIAVHVEKLYIPVESVTLDKHTLEMTVGDEYTLNATILPENATNQNIQWISSSEYFATVEDGKVTALHAGEVTITAQAVDKVDQCVITIKEQIIPVTSVRLDLALMTLFEGETGTLTATVGPDNATDKTVTWSTSNASVATVSDGVVTAVKAGTATITAKAGDKSAVCTVNVSKAPVINLPYASTETGGRVEMPGSFPYSISNPVSGVELYVYSTVNWIEITEVTPTEVKYKTKKADASDRTGTISLNYSGAESKTFTVYQRGFNYDWTTITATPTSIDAPASGKTYTVSYTIQNPVEGYPVSARTYPSNDWITSIQVNPTSSSAGTATFTVKENTTTQKRQANFILQSAAFVNNAVISVSQNGKPAGPPDIDLAGRDLNATYGLYPLGEEECFYAAVVNPVEGVELKITGDASWMRGFRDDANGYYHYFTAAANYTGSTRYGNVTLTYGSVTKVIKYSQESADVNIVLTPNNATFDYHARTVSFEVSLPDGSNYDQLRVETGATRYVKNIQRNGRKVTFDLRENNDGSDRDADIEVSYGSYSAVFHLKQTFTAPVFHVYPSTSITVGYPAADHPIDVQVENAREEVSLSLLNVDNPGWISCRTVDGVPTFRVTQNTTGQSRSTRVRVGYSIDALGHQDVTVTQTTASTTISVTPARIDCGAAGTTQTLTFSITDPLSGVDMRATEGSPWITVRSISNTSATVMVSKNLANKARSSNVTFYYGSFSVVVPVTQQGNDLPAGFVDLGLPSGTLWAEVNVGAASDYEAGSFFAWAEKTPKSSFSWNNYLWGTEDNFTKYNSTDKKTLVELADDPAYQANSSWILPTRAQFLELINYCAIEWVDDPPYYGMRFKSRVGDTSIFFPAAGFIEAETDGEWGGYYWSRTLDTYDDTLSRAYSLLIWNDVQAFCEQMDRCAGMLVRAVKK